MFRWGRESLDRFVSGMPDMIYWVAVALGAFLSVGFLISLLGMILPLILFGAVAWFLLGCIRDPRFYDLVDWVKKQGRR